MIRSRSLLLVAMLLACPALQAGPQPSTFSAQIFTVDGQGVVDAVLSLTPLDAPAPPVRPPAEPIRIVQTGMEYRPPVTAIQVGTEIEFPNQDDVQHHLYSVSRPKRFEKPLYAPGAKEVVLFDQPGVVLLGCNIHDWMSAYVVIVETPYLALSDSTGMVTVAGLPAGRYQLEIWHARLPRPIREELSLGESPGEPREFRLNLRPERRPRRAPTPERPGYP